MLQTFPLKVYIFFTSVSSIVRYWLTAHQIIPAVKALSYAYSPTILLYFVVATAVSICTLQTLKLKVKDQHVRRNVLLALTILVVATFVSSIRLFATLSRYSCVGTGRRTPPLGGQDYSQAGI
jgi:hypothetical protein